MAMNWLQLLSRRRLGRDVDPAPEAARTEFQRDFDRIVFTSSFRRLQDKTQVFPLARDDYARTRLTHSLESASVGRSLGTVVGMELLDRHKELAEEGYTPHDFGAVVAAATLAHDIGNPPFGHAGESAIQEWFTHTQAGQQVLGRLTAEQRRDFEKFEGNAQGFRVLTRLESAGNRGGMQLTLATLGAYMKYPRASLVSLAEPKGASRKKYGFFTAEQALFEEVAAQLGLMRWQAEQPAWCRHPFAFLVEAADDICYHIVDIEDGVRLGHVRFEDARELLVRVIGDGGVADAAKSKGDTDRQIEYLRARAINAVIDEVGKVFLARERELLDATLDAPLTDLIDQADALKSLKSLAAEKVYGAPPVVEIEAAGFEVLGALLEAFVAAADDLAQNGEGARMRSRMLLGLIPSHFLGPDRTPDPDSYRRVLAITDFVAGMTDSYAIATYQKIRGIALNVSGRRS